MLNKKIILATFLTTLLLTSILSTQTAYATTDPAVTDLTGTESSDSTGLTTSTPGTSTTMQGLSTQVGRKCFYYNGRFYIFYSDGTNWVCQNSTDGSTWTTKSIIRAWVIGDMFTVWFNGTHVFYTYCQSSNNKAIVFRFGTLSSNGEISWQAAEATAVAAPGAGKGVYTMGIATNSSGGILLAYRSDTAAKGTFLPYIGWDSACDGTWTSISGFPKTLNATGQTTYSVKVVPLTSGKFFALYSWAGGSVYGAAWDGSAFKSQVNTSRVSSTGNYSCVAEGDDVHIVFSNSSAINYVKYTYSSNTLSSETNVQSLTSATNATLSIDTNTNILYCFWSGQPTVNHIYYKRCVSGTWDTGATDWITEGSTLTGSGITSSYNTNTTRPCVMYMTATASPYNVKVACVQNSYDISGYTGYKGLMAGDDTTSIAFALKLNNTFPSLKVGGGCMEAGDKYEINFTIDNNFVIDFVATSGASAGKLIFFYKSGGVWVAGDSLTQTSIASGTLYSSASGNISFKLTDYSSSDYGYVKFVVSRDYLKAHGGAGSTLTSISGASYKGSSTATNPGEDGGTKKDRSPSGSGTASYILQSGTLPEFPFGMLLLAVPVIAIYLFFRKRSAIRFSTYVERAA